MIKEYATNLAKQSGIQLSGVSVIEGRKVGCSNAHLLHLIAGGNLVSALVHQSELDELQSCTYCERLEIKIKTALSRLQALMETGYADYRDIYGLLIGTTMIRDYVTEIASQLKVQLSNVTVVASRNIDCFDAHQLNIEAEGKQISILLYQSELDELQSTSVSVWLEQRIRSALSRLQTQMTSG